MKYSAGFTCLRWPPGMIVITTTSFLMVSKSLKTIPAGTAYAVWTGIGTAFVPGWILKLIRPFHPRA